MYFPNSLSQFRNVRAKEPVVELDRVFMLSVTILVIQSEEILRKHPFKYSFEKMLVPVPQFSNNKFVNKFKKLQLNFTFLMAKQDEHVPFRTIVRCMYRLLLNSCVTI